VPPTALYDGGRRADDGDWQSVRRPANFAVSVRNDISSVIRQDAAADQGEGDVDWEKNELLQYGKQ